MTTGQIIMYYGDPAAVPAGWHLCDGTGGTPDLSNTFIVGANSYDGAPKSSIAGAPAATGGAVSHTHALTGSAVIRGGSDFNGTLTNANNAPPWRALFYIMKV